MVAMEQAYPYITHRRYARLRAEIADAVEQVPERHNRVRAEVPGDKVRGCADTARKAGKTLGHSRAVGRVALYYHQVDRGTYRYPWWVVEVEETTVQAKERRSNLLVIYR